MPEVEQVLSELSQAVIFHLLQDLREHLPSFGRLQLRVIIIP